MGRQDSLFMFSEERGMGGRSHCLCSESTGEWEGRIHCLCSERTGKSEGWIHCSKRTATETSAISLQGIRF